MNFRDLKKIGMLKKISYFRPIKAIVIRLMIWKRKFNFNKTIVRNWNITRIAKIYLSVDPFWMELKLQLMR